MNQVRGVVLLIAGGIALYLGWRFHSGAYAWRAYGLGLIALGLSAWLLTRKRR